jgi:hypothetical protein
VLKKYPPHYKIMKGPDGTAWLDTPKYEVLSTFISVYDTNRGPMDPLKLWVTMANSMVEFAEKHSKRKVDVVIVGSIYFFFSQFTTCKFSSLKHFLHSYFFLYNLQIVNSVQILSFHSEFSFSLHFTSCKFSSFTNCFSSLSSNL